MAVVLLHQWSPWFFTWSFCKAGIPHSANSSWWLTLKIDPFTRLFEEKETPEPICPFCWDPTPNGRGVWWVQKLYLDVLFLLDFKMDHNASTSNWTAAASKAPNLETEFVHQDSFGFGSLQVLVFVISALLNILTVSVFVSSHLLHTANNFLVAALATSDLCYITLVISTSLVSLSNDVGYSGFTCTLLGYFMQLMYCLSINICCLISFHRFMSIRYPQSKFLWSMHGAKRAMVLLVVFTALCCTPGLGRSSYDFNHVVATCALLLPKGGDQVSSVYVFLLNFILPSGLIVMFYLRIYQRVVHDRPSLVKETVQSSLLRTKTKLLLAAVLIIYFFCWAPYYVLLLFTSWGSIAVSRPIMILVWVAKLLSTVAHPILYALCNRLFMVCVLRFLHCRSYVRPERSLHGSPVEGPVLHKQSRFPTCVGNENISTIGSLPQIEALSRHRQCNRRASIFSAETQSTGSSGQSHQFQPAVHSLDGRRIRSFSRQDSTPTVLRMRMHMQKPRGCDLTASTKAFGRTPKNSTPTSSLQYISVHDPEASDDTEAFLRQDSTPTILQLPLSRHSMTDSQHAFGRTPPDSRRSSYASNLPNSSRTSVSSFYVPSARTSVSSAYTYSYVTPQGTRPNSEADNSKSLRHTTSAHSSVSRSVHSSVSSYPPNGEYSLPGTPSYSEMRLSSTNIESIYIPPPPDDSGDQQQFVQRKKSFQQSQVLEKILEHRDVDSVLSDSSSSQHTNSYISTNNASDDNIFTAPPGGTAPMETDIDRGSPRNRISAVMFGEIEPEEANALVEEEERELRNRKRGGTLWDLAKKLPQLNPKVRKAVEILVKLHQDSMEKPATLPHSAPCSPLNWNSCQQTPRPLSARGEVPMSGSQRVSSNTGKEQDDRRDSFYDTMEKAVYLVLKAKRMHSTMQSAASTTTPTASPPPSLTPKEHAPSPEPAVQVTEGQRIREMPVRYVYEKPIPTYSQMPMMQLRVPRTVPFHVPQTIMEEEVADPSQPPETPSRRRKNASTWIAPPVIDREQGEDSDMRVATPGVMVEHHHWVRQV